MKKLFFLLLFCLVGKFATAQETVMFQKRDQSGNLVKLTVTFAPERRDCKVFSEYAGQKQEYWVIDTEGAGKAQIFTVRYNYKDAILKRDGQFVTLQWKEKTAVEKYGKEISFAQGVTTAPNCLYVIQYNAQETAFYFINAAGKVLPLDIDKDSPAKYWDKQLDATQAQVFKLSDYRVKESITFTIQETNETLSILQIGDKKYSLVPFDEY